MNSSSSSSSSSEGEDDSSGNDEEEDSSDSESDGDDKVIVEGKQFPLILEEESDAEESEGDNNDHSINVMQSGSFEEMPTPGGGHGGEEEPRGSPLERLVSSASSVIFNATSAAAAVIGSFNASPSSTFIGGQNLSQRFEDINQNRRRSGRERKKTTVFDPSSKKR